MVEVRERFAMYYHPDDAFGISPLEHNSWASVLEPFRHELRFFQIEPEATLFHQGMSMTGVYFLYEGKVKAEYSLEKGKKVLLNIVWPVVLIDPCIAKDLHQVSVIALEKSTIGTVSVATYRGWLQRDRRLFDAHQNAACEYMAWLQRRLCEYAHVGVRDRLLVALLEFSKPFQSAVNPEHAEIKLTGEEMATLVGTSRETVVRELSLLKERGLVHVEHSCITIKSIHDLRDYYQKRRNP